MGPSAKVATAIFKRIGNQITRFAMLKNQTTNKHYINSLICLDTHLLKCQRVLTKTFFPTQYEVGISLLLISDSGYSWKYLICKRDVRAASVYTCITHARILTLLACLLHWLLACSLACSLACLLARLLACSLARLLACSLAGLLACWLAGLLACWLAGLLACLLLKLSFEFTQIPLNHYKILLNQKKAQNFYPCLLFFFVPKLATLW